jgi:hypothetical protein
MVHDDGSLVPALIVLGVLIGLCVLAETIARRSGRKQPLYRAQHWRAGPNRQYDETPGVAEDLDDDEPDHGQGFIPPTPRRHP